MKKDVSKKLILNKKTISRLNYTEMNESHGGIRPSRIGVSCWTGRCCYSKKECDEVEG
jgi:hypothetical protein